MKHFLLVIFLAGCPDVADDTTTLPFDPHNPCVGFGVTFSAPRFGDSSYFSYAPGWAGAYGSDVKPVAVGGVEYVNVYGSPYIDLMTPTFDATVNGPAIAIDPSRVPSANSPAPVLGMTDGIADLCIYDHGSTTLHDGTRMIARSVESMIALPSTEYYQPYQSQPFGTVYPFSNWRMFVGKRRSITVALLGADDWRLVDQGMTIDLADDADFTHGTTEQWDSVSRDIDHATTVQVRATLHDGNQWWAAVGFVDRVDTIAMIPQTYLSLQTLRLDYGWTRLCFTSSIDGATVIAAPYAFTATPVVTLHPETQPDGCIYLEPVDSGTGTLTVAIGDTTLDVPFKILPTGS